MSRTLSVEITGEEQFPCGCWLWHEGASKSYPAAGRGATWVIQRYRPKPQYHYTHAGIHHFFQDRQSAVDFHESCVRLDPKWCTPKRRKRTN